MSEQSATHTKSTADVQDDFQRQDLGTSWTVYNGDVAIIDGQLGLATRSGNLHGMGLVAWSGTTLSADQYSQVTVAPGKPTEALLQVFVRRSAGDLARYGFHWNSRFDGRWELKLDGREPGVVLVSVPGEGPQDGDVLRIEVVGNTLTGYLNGAELLRTTDSELTEPGEAGTVFAALPSIGPESFPLRMITAWSGGSLTPSA